jgi:DNA mismatch endonuclease, patch repair protein
MPDNLTPEDRLKTMRAVKGKGTRLERRLSSMLAGMRVSGWRKNVADMIGKPDIVFKEDHLVIFIDGCFWHGCPYCNRKLPETNKEYWEQKIQRNVERAKIQNQKLAENGWSVIRIWEHELRDPNARARIRKEIRQALSIDNG